MHFLTAVVMVIVSMVPTGVVEARERPAGPPTTLASQRPVSDDAVEPEFSIDFLGVFYEGAAEGGAVRFRHDGRWGPWVELQEDGVEVDGRWASALVPASDAEAYQVRVPGGARERGPWRSTPPMDPFSRRRRSAPPALTRPRS